MLTLVLGLAAGAAAWLGWRRRGDARRATPIALALTALVCAAAAAWTAPAPIVLGKVVALLVMPVGLIWLGAIALTAHLARRGQRREAIALGVLTALLTLAGNRPLSEAAFAWLEEDYADVDVFAGRPLDAVIVLGGGTRSDIHGRPEAAEAGDRLVLAARLFHAGRAPRIAISGAAIEGFDPHDSMSATRALLEGLGVPADAIVGAPGARNTREEARVHARLARERGWERVGLVTSAWHMRRATRLFQREGLEVQPLPADARGSYHWMGLPSIVPRGRALDGTELVVWELLGAALGR